MAPLKSSIGRNVGKFLAGFRTSTLGFQLRDVATVPLAASGGSTFIAGGRKVHKFTSNQNFVVAAGSSDDIAVMLVGGGGSGGGDSGGGGGAGAVIIGTGITYEPGTYAVVVGAGGAEVPGYYGDPEANFRNSHCGKDSTLAHPGGTITGGGGNSGGMTYTSPYAQSPISDGNAGSLGCNGGSNVGSPTSPATIPQAALTSPYPVPSAGTFTVHRNPGGTAQSPGSNQWIGGGGGGAGGAGVNGVGNAGHGGAGYDAAGNLPWIPSSEGVSGLFAGGGGAGAPDNGSGGGGNGGTGGGGSGGAEGGASSTAGGTNTGGGGGGNDAFPGKAGGSGIVYISYPE